jgi:hypothetical protein
MFLFKARLAAQKEYADLLEKFGVTAEQVADFLKKHPRWASPLHRAPHGAAGTAADRLVEVAGFVGKPEWQVKLLEAQATARAVVGAAKGLPDWLARTRKKVIERSPVLFAQAREEWVEARPVLVEKMKARAQKTVFARFAGETPAQATA